MVINVGKKTFNWTQLVSIVAPVWLKRLSWKVMRCCTLGKVCQMPYLWKIFPYSQPEEMILAHWEKKVAKKCNQSGVWGRICLEPLQLCDIRRMYVSSASNFVSHQTFPQKYPFSALWSQGFHFIPFCTVSVFTISAILQWPLAKSTPLCNH